MDFLQIMEVIRAMRVHTLMDDEVFPLLFGCESLPTVRAQQTGRGGDEITGTEGLAADLALILAVAAVVIVDKVVRGTAQMADDIIGDRVAIAPIDGPDRFSIFP